MLVCFTGNYLTNLLNSKNVSESFVGIQADSLITNALTNFLNPCSILDIFYLKTEELFIIPTLQSVLDTATTDFFLSL